MQAITIAIGKPGITFFAQHYLVDTLSGLLGKLAPPDKTVQVPDFSPPGNFQYDNIRVELSNGSVQNFHPEFLGAVQGVSNDGKNTPVFTVSMQVNNFNAQYNWLECYHYAEEYWVMVGKIPVQKTRYGDKSIPYAYSPGIGGLSVAIDIQFLYDSAKNLWEFSVNSSTPTVSGVQPNIPSGSILNGQVQAGCTETHVDDATAQAIDSIDFKKVVGQELSGVVQTIPGSGKLGDNIVYDFSMGDSGMLFPNNNGIQIGVKGGVNYNNETFPGAPPKSTLALPAPPDTHHLNMYVSDYEVNALLWAFFKADRLNTVFKPNDLTDPDILKVKTYVDDCDALKPYRTLGMQANVDQKIAPAVQFQLVYEFTDAAINSLKNSVSDKDFNILENGFAKNNYVTLSDLESDLTASDIDPKSFTAIENATKQMGMVVSHDILFTLTILSEASEQPTIDFDVTRTDILGNLKLGIREDKAQTMQFDFFHATWKATFKSSSIKGLDGSALRSIWRHAGENEYDTVLVNLGATGVPLPIMSGFKFDFDNAQISIQDNYVSILSDVVYTS